MQQVHTELPTAQVHSQKAAGTSRPTQQACEQNALKGDSLEAALHGVAHPHGCEPVAAVLALPPALGGGDALHRVRVAAALGAPPLRGVAAQRAAEGLAGGAEMRCVLVCGGGVMGQGGGGSVCVCVGVGVGGMICWG